MNGLFGSTVLDVAIGLIFVYLLLAIICTSLNEWISSAFSLRAKNLALGIRQLLDNQPKPVSGDPAKATSNTDWLISEFYAHPLMTGMRKGDKHPSYVSARAFATTLMDIISGPEAQLTYENFKAGFDKLPDGDVKKVLSSLMHTSGQTLGEVQGNIEKWFDDSMDRVSGWYKRKIQWITAVVALLLAFATNADSIRIAEMLWHNPEIRAEGVKLAEQRAEAAKNGAPAPEPNTAEAEITYPDASNPLNPSATIKPVTQQERAYLTELIGWQGAAQFRNLHARDILLMILGWVLTGLAVSLGAPFWFDVLNKVINIRGTGKAPSEKPKAPSKTPIPDAEETTTA